MAAWASSPASAEHAAVVIHDIEHVDVRTVREEQHRLVASRCPDERLDQIAQAPHLLAPSCGARVSWPDWVAALGSLATDLVDGGEQQPPVLREVLTVGGEAAPDERDRRHVMRSEEVVEELPEKVARSKRGAPIQIIDRKNVDSSRWAIIGQDVGFGQLVPDPTPCARSEYQPPRRW